MKLNFIAFISVSFGLTCLSIFAGLLAASGDEKEDNPNLSKPYELYYLDDIIVDSSGHRGLGTQGIDRFGDVVYLTFFGKNFSKVDKEVLLSAPELVELRMGFTFPVDQDMKMLPKFKNLQSLAIGDPAKRGRFCKITNKGVSEIAKIKKLSNLELSSINIDDDGIQLLKKLKKLEDLLLASENITDKSIDAIAEIPNLYYVSLSGTSVSKEGVQRLRKLKPKLKVHSRFDD